MLLKPGDAMVHLGLCAAYAMTAICKKMRSKRSAEVVAAKDGEENVGSGSSHCDYALSALGYIKEYERLRLRDRSESSGPTIIDVEIAYNAALLHHIFGMHAIAASGYVKTLSLLESLRSSRVEAEQIRQKAAHHLSLIVRSASGNVPGAVSIAREHLVI